MRKNGEFRINCGWAGAAPNVWNAVGAGAALNCKNWCWPRVCCAGWINWYGSVWTSWWLDCCTAARAACNCCCWCCCCCCCWCCNAAKCDVASRVWWWWLRLNACGCVCMNWGVFNWNCWCPSWNCDKLSSWVCGWAWIKWFALGSWTICSCWYGNWLCRPNAATVCCCCCCSCCCCCCSGLENKMKIINLIIRIITNCNVK